MCKYINSYTDINVSLLIENYMITYMTRICIQYLQKFGAFRSYENNMLSGTNDI